LKIQEGPRPLPVPRCRRPYLRPGAKKYFRPPTKIAELEMKNRYKNALQAKAEHLLFVAAVLFQRRA